MAESLVVYYSHSANTKRIAELIQKLIGSDLLELEPVSPYPQLYDAIVYRSKREIQTGFLPPLQTRAPSLNQYERIYIGSPNWWSTIAPPVASFLSQNNFEGKTVHMFLTHGGRGTGRMENDIAKLCQGNIRKPALVLSGNGGSKAKAVTAAWLKTMGEKGYKQTQINDDFCCSRSENETPDGHERLGCLVEPTGRPKGHRQSMGCGQDQYTVRVLKV